jgi:hypothetical protein
LLHFKEYFTPNTHSSALVLYTSLFVAHLSLREGAYRVLERKPEGKRLLGRTGYRWEDSIKTDLQ